MDTRDHLLRGRKAGGTFASLTHLSPQNPHYDVANATIIGYIENISHSSENIMSTQTLLKPDESATLTKALLNAGKSLGLTQEALGQVVGRDRTAFHRAGIDPQSKAGELSLLVIRLYRSLYVLVGGKAAAMRHWMQTPNHHTGGVPAEQVKTVPGLMRLVEYLDAMRGKV
jgi:hypothetical protein